MSNSFKKFFLKSELFFLAIILAVPILILAEDEPIELDGPTLLPVAQLYITSDQNDIPVNSNFNVPIYINTQGKSINTVKIDLNFDPSKVSIVGSSGTGSILGILFESPVYNNENGMASITGIIPNGINTNSGLIATLTFKAISEGETTIYLNDYSSANLNDGVGSEVVLTLDNVTYHIIEQEQNICITNPEDPSCIIPTPTFCELNPTDPSCVVPTPTFCELYPTNPACVAPTLTFCELHPTNPACVAPTLTFCELHPSDPLCVDVVGDVNEDDNNEDQEETTDTGEETQLPGEVVSVITKDISKAVTNIKKEVVNTLNTEEGEITSQVITTAGATTGVVVGVATGLFANPLTLGELLLVPIRLWGLLLTALGIRKRNVPWGTVYDSVTKQPLDPAYVVLKDLEGNEIATSITDIDGRYGFLVLPGKYKLSANKTNYEFPSKKLAGQTNDELYNELYFDDVIEINEGGVITRNIPMDPLKFDWNEFAKKDKKLMKFFRKKDLWIARISLILFIIGFIISVIATLVDPSTYNIVISIVYIVLFVMKRTVLKPRPFGYIRQKETKGPLSFAILRAYYSSGSGEAVHKVADKNGKYYCLIPNGKYSLKVENKNVDGSYSPVGQFDNIEVKRGYINKKFDI